MQIKRSNKVPVIGSMSQRKLITSLPSSLSCNILRDWLEMKSVVALDSAYCCHADREEFLDFLQSDEFLVKEQVVISQNSAVSSLLKKFGEKIRSVEFEDPITPAQEELVQKHCHNLMHVEFLDEEHCTPELWAVLRTNPRIEYLKIIHNDREPSGRPFCRSFEGIVLPKLTTLTLNCYNVATEEILDVLKTSGVIRLDLSYCSVACSILLHIAHLCPQLRILKLTDVVGLTDDILHEFTITCPHIEHLDISFAEQITDNGILSVVRNLNGLQNLNIERIACLTDISLNHICGYGATTLHTLLMDCFELRMGYWGFSAAAINELLERCTHIHTLLFCVPTLLPSIHFEFSPAAVRNLTYLVLGGMAASDVNLLTIGAYGFNLQKLILDSGRFYAHDAFAAIVNSCPSLRELYYQSPWSRDHTIYTNKPPSYWMNIRPGLKVGYLKSGWDSQHDVMNM